MNEVGLFVAGGVVTLITFVGVLLYGMFSFDRWSRTDASPRSDRA